MEQELHTAFCPLCSLYRGGWLIQGHLFLLPALRHPSNCSFSCPKQLGSSTGWSYPCKTCASCLHFICYALGGGDREGENLYFKHLHDMCFQSTWGGFSPFLPELTHSTHKTILFRARRWLLTGRICIAWGHQTQDQAVTHHQDHSGGYKPAPFCVCIERHRAKENPCCPLCASLPFMKTFPMQKSTAFSNPRCQHACT